MTEQQVLEALEEEMSKHGLLDEGWTYGIHHRKNQVGVCSDDMRLIQISHKYAAANPDQAIIIVIRHEIAHAIVGDWHGHDEVWRSCCLRIGGDGQQYFSGFNASRTGKQTPIHLSCDAGR